MKHIFIFLFLITVAYNGYTQDFGAKADSLHRIKNYKSAIYFYTKSIEEEKRLASYWGRANSKFQFNDFVGAIKDYAFFLELCKDKDKYFPDFVENLMIHINRGLAYEGMGLCYIAIGDRQKGCESFSKALDYGYDASKNITEYCN